MTQAQKDNVKRFKAVQVEAKKLKAKNPKLKHIDAVKQAWAILYSKVKKSAKKKVGAIKIVQKDKNEKVTKVLKQVRAKKTGQFKGYKQIAGVKAKKVSGRTGTAHKDTKSHNVNIRVVSGIVQPKLSVKIISKKIQKLTDINDHNKAVLQLAKFLKEKKSIVLMNSVIKMHNNYGSMTKELIDIRNKILNDLLKKSKNMYGEVDYKLIYNSF